LVNKNVNLNDKDLLSKVIVALDGMDIEQTIQLLKSCNGEILTAKIGMELFYKYGPKFLLHIKKQFGIEIFLDLKLHDIPNTVAGAIRSLKGLPVKFLTIHLAGGKEMIKRAKEARDKYIPDCKLLGVTYLTSLSSSEFENIWGIKDSNINDQFSKMFSLALNSKIDGIILSANELRDVSDFETNSDHSLIKICPGIRFKDEINSNKIGDQKRVQTPDQAVRDGANYLVMGRSLTKAKNINIQINKLKEMKL
jgi:orotidine-5'-phosphate decarboxylase